MRLDEYMSFDATGLAELVSKGEVTAVELLTLAREREAQVNPRINAIIAHIDEADARATDPSPYGPFAGVPFLVKDLDQEYKGYPTSYGSRSFARNIATEHALIVQRFLDAGLVIFGKTNAPEFGIKNVTEPELWRPARNPCNTAHTPGGSSGGSAAAVPPASSLPLGATMEAARSALLLRAASDIDGSCHLGRRIAPHVGLLIGCAGRFPAPDHGREQIERLQRRCPRPGIGGPIVSSAGSATRRPGSPCRRYPGTTSAPAESSWRTSATASATRSCGDPRARCARPCITDRGMAVGATHPRPAVRPRARRITPRRDATGLSWTRSRTGPPDSALEQAS